MEFIVPLVVLWAAHPHLQPTRDGYFKILHFYLFFCTFSVKLGLKSQMLIYRTVWLNKGIRLKHYPQLYWKCAKNDPLLLKFWSILLKIASTSMTGTSSISPYAATLSIPSVSNLAGISSSNMAGISSNNGLQEQQLLIQNNSTPINKRSMYLVYLNWKAEITIIG